MLDVIADFWKPVKKVQQQERLQEDQLQIGSSIGFGFVPQHLLSARRLTVSAINTYQFGTENLTSYVLSQDREPSVQMIIAEADGEQYLAVSRRIPIEERTRLFDEIDLESCLINPDVQRLACKDNVPEFKSWLVSSYKREINGLKGRIYKGDHRKIPLPATSEGQDFTYSLLVSDSNEHALEIEKYLDGRMEIYATIYRRINDVGEISHPVGEVVARPEIKLAAKTQNNQPQNNKPQNNKADNSNTVNGAANAASSALLEPVVVHKPAVAKQAEQVDIVEKAPVEAKAAPKLEESKTSIEVKPVEAPHVEKPSEEKAASKSNAEEPITMQAAQFNVAAEPVKPMTADAKPASEVKESEVKTPEIKTNNAQDTSKATSTDKATEVTAESSEKVAENTDTVKTEQAVQQAPNTFNATSYSKEVDSADDKTVQAPAKPETPSVKPPMTQTRKAATDTQTTKENNGSAEKAATANESTKENNTMSSNNEAAAVNGTNQAETKPTLYVSNNGQDNAQSVKAVSGQGQLENDAVECDLRVANKLIDEAIRNEMRLNDVVRRVIELPVANPESVQIPVTLTDEDYALLAIRYGIAANDRNAIKQRIIDDLNDFSGE